MHFSRRATHELRALWLVNFVQSSVIVLFLTGCSAGTESLSDAALSDPLDAATPESRRGSATISGTIRGAPFIALDAYFCDPPAIEGLLVSIVTIADFPNACVNQSLRRPGDAFLHLSYESDPYGEPNDHNRLRLPAFNEFDAEGMAQRIAGTGSIMLTAAAEPRTGTFELTLETGDHISGSFSAGCCDSDCVSCP